MNIPNQIVVQTKSYLQIVTKLNLYIAKFGCEAVESYLDSIPLKMTKADGKHIGAYIVNKICEEFRNEGITRYDLYESNERSDALLDARLLLCVLVNRYTNLPNTEISRMFNRSRHTAKRALTDFKKLDENIPQHRKLLERFARLDTLISAYMNFKPKSKKS